MEEGIEMQLRYKIQKAFTPIKSGFTLVELLIVIGLLGAIALIVISAINPIEQSNRARDTKYKADVDGRIVKGDFTKKQALWKKEHITVTD